MQHGDVQIDGTAAITHESAGQSDGSIDVDFIGFNWMTNYNLTISYSGSGSFTTQTLTNIPFTNPSGTTTYNSTLTGLNAGNYTFIFQSFRNHARHDGTIINTTCNTTINITVPLG